ncbi:AAA family ATPase [Brevibacillus fulvus]|uniref:Pilus assembly protein CpaE n=1 Tax=Brevibacillus fulvus TaxID=1125967 RepID=A0A938Y6L3_9BACL|nr:AAA family ATPase [Brevibacillus fulvus]MBM7592195.1 pilus assembly protein CpaE [Brevibacillus fulvus]
MNREKKRLLIFDDERSLYQLRQNLAGSSRIEPVAEIARWEELWQAMAEVKPDAVLLGSLPEIDWGEFSRQMQLYYPQTALMAACSLRELNWEPFLRNLGFWVIGKPIQVAQLEMLVSRMEMPCIPVHPGSSVAVGDNKPPADSAPAPSANESKQIITVYGPKGGVGKTFLSRELAVYFTQQKRENRPLKVLAVDFNLDLGTFATSLNLPRTPNLFGWVQAIDQLLMAVVEREGRHPQSLSHAEWQEHAAAVRISPQEIRQYVVVHEPTGLHVLTSPRDIRYSFEIKDYHLYLMLEALRLSDYDVILIDTAPDTTDATVQALFFAQRVIMVGNPVVDSIENIQRMLKLLREAEYPEERIQLCINRLQRKEMFTLEEMRAYFQLHPSKKLYTIPDDEEVKKSINTGMPMILQGKSAAREALEMLGRSLLPVQAEKPEEEKGLGGKPKKRASLFSWLWG